jgi:glutathione S-transferase
MRLYYSPGASSLFPHIVLVEAGVPFDAIKIDEHAKVMEGGGDYRTINPLGYVPALQLDDGTVLTESAAIAQYVADQVPARTLAPPNGTLERTKLQSWLNFLSSEIHMGGFCPLFHPGIPTEAKQIFRERLADRLAHVDEQLAKNEYLMGTGLSLADIYLFVATNWARSVNVDLSPYPNLLALRKRVAARPGVQTTMKSEGLVA